MVKPIRFEAYANKPLYRYDSQRVSELKRLNASTVQTKDITDLAALLIRYEYPEDLMEINTSWGMSVNMLLALARTAWEKGQSSANGDIGGSGWDSASDD